MPLIQCIQRDEATLAAVSPAGHLQSLRAPVLLVHGAGDTVIPASETRWLAKGVPPALLHGALISRALQHVELDGQPGWKDEWELIHFMANVLKETDGLRP